MKMNSKTKKIISSLLIATTLSIPTNVVLAKEESMTHKEIKVYFNNEQIEFDQQPIIVDGRTKVPFRAIFETMGTVVYYRESDSSILGLTRDGDTIYHQVGTNKATINGVEKTYDSVSEIRNDRTLIPVRMVADLLSAEVEWKTKTQTVEIEKEIETNDYHKKIRGIIGCVLDQNFNPEDFKRYLDYQYNNWNMDPKQVILDVNMDLDRELVEVNSSKNIRGSHFDAKEEDVEIIKDTSNPLILINRFHKLPKDYEAQNIISSVDYNQSYHPPYWSLIQEAGDAINNLINDAKTSGLDIPVIMSTYNYDEIGSIIPYMHDSEEAFGYNFCQSLGFNEHQTGLAVDIVSWATDQSTFLTYLIDYNIPAYNMAGPRSREDVLKEYEHYKDEVAENNMKYNWLEENSYKYGYILRYPKDKVDITKYYYAPWHYRYVGMVAAKIMHDENLCLEEYWAKYLNPSKYKTDLESTKKKVLERY